MKLFELNDRSEGAILSNAWVTLGKHLTYNRKGHGKGWYISFLIPLFIPKVVRDHWRGVDAKGLYGVRVYIGVRYLRHDFAPSCRWHWDLLNSMPHSVVHKGVITKVATQDVRRGDLVVADDEGVRPYGNG